MPTKDKMPFGSIFADMKDVILETADNKKISLGGGLLPKIALKILGIPHIGLRMRASVIFRMLGGKRHGRVLDAGCGPGTYSLTLASNGFEVSGFDINKKKVSQAIKISRELDIPVNFSVANVYHLKKYKSNCFDVVICSDVLEHLKNDSLAVKELARLLKDDGKLIITVPTDTKLNRKYKKSFGHERLYMLQSMSELLRKNGLIIEKSISYLCFFGRMSWIINRSLFRSKILTAITFPPLFMLTYLDYLFNLGGGEGIAVKAVKQH